MHQPGALLVPNFPTRRPRKRRSGASAIDLPDDHRLGIDARSPPRYGAAHASGRGHAALPDRGLEGLRSDCRTTVVLESLQSFFVIFFIRFHRLGLSPMIGGDLGKRLAETVRGNQGNSATSLDEEKGKWSVMGACFVHAGSSDALLPNAVTSDGVLLDVEWLDVVEVRGFDRPSGEHLYSNERSRREWIRTSVCQARACHSRTSENDSLIVNPVRSRSSILKSGVVTASEIAESSLTARSVGYEAAKFLVLSRTNLALLIRFLFRPPGRKKMGGKSRVAASSSEDEVPTHTFASRPHNLNVTRTELIPSRAGTDWRLQVAISKSHRCLSGQWRERVSRSITGRDSSKRNRLLARGNMGEDLS